jgi:hypothetical protein
MQLILGRRAEAPSRPIGFALKTNRSFWLRAKTSDADRPGIIATKRS